MKQVRTMELTQLAVTSPLLQPAVPLDGRGHRSNETLLRLDERRRYLREAARFYPGISDREVARQLRLALARYRDGRWRRDRAEARCPPRHRGSITELLWMIFKAVDTMPGDRTVRAALAPREPDG